MLRALPDIGPIYLLIRPRVGATAVEAAERLEREVVATGAFDRLKEEWGAAFPRRLSEKVRVVSGDIAADRLGLSDADYEQLTSEVSIVVNCAALVVFDEPLDRALALNAIAARRVAEFARACGNARLVHVSTAYVNGRNPAVAREVVLPSEGQVPPGWEGPVLPDDPEAEIGRLLSLCAQVEAESHRPARARYFVREARRGPGSDGDAPHVEDPVEGARRRWVKERLIRAGMAQAKARGWNDTYTFTKALGEQLIVRVRGDMPTAIVRPSIIESSLNEPEPGWIDGLRMADPVIIAYGKGRVPDFPANPNIVIDFIPVDYVVNAILAIVPHLDREGGLEVFHVATGTANPLTFGVLYDRARAHFREEPMLDRNGMPIAGRAWSFPSVRAFRRQLRYRYLYPLRIAAAFLNRLGNMAWTRRVRYRLGVALNALERLDYYAVIYGPYVRRSYLFDTSRTEALYDRLSDAERRRYCFDLRAIDWQHYIQRVHIPGLRRNVLKIGQGRARPPIAEEALLDAKTRPADAFSGPGYADGQEDETADAGD
jgi:nucleoside-diphosphate-sugar epimerase